MTLEGKLYFSTKDLNLLSCIAKNAKPIQWWEQNHLALHNAGYQLRCYQDSNGCDYQKRLCGANYCLFDMATYNASVMRTLSEDG